MPWKYVWKAGKPFGEVCWRDARGNVVARAPVHMKGHMMQAGPVICEHSVTIVDAVHIASGQQQPVPFLAGQLPLTVQGGDKVGARWEIEIVLDEDALFPVVTEL